ncbi:acylphosphatase [Pseudactinotalea sp.]|uniref:acylphosphatase n=1 Tax=Pseudactinotalea sp. TaxID=1926260 RepID=UPI003B3B7B41
MRRVHLVVRGKVQGVGYRYSMQRRAADLGVVGWVRNRRDGSVEAEIEGTDQQVEAILAWAEQGPPMAHVDAVTVTEVDPTGESGGFDTRSTH